VKKRRKPAKAQELPVLPESRKFLKTHGWRLAVVILAVVAAYSNSFQSGFVFDNLGVIGMDPRIQSATAGNVGRIFTEGYWHVNATSGLYRPVTTLTYLLNYAILGEGLDPAGYHWINLFLHVANVALVYALGFAFMGEAATAMALAAVWGLHPLLTESVTNIVGRADLLAGFGVLLGLLSYMRGLAETGRRRWAWFAVVIGAQTVGLFSKENALVLPLLMLLYDRVYPDRARWRDRLPVYGALVLPFGALLAARIAQHASLQIPFSENPLVRADFLSARLTAVKVIGKFFGLFLWPARLSNDYSYNAVPVFSWGPGAVGALLALGVCAGMLVFGHFRRIQYPAAAFFIGFFFVALIPTANLIVLIGSIMAERFLYLPAVGLAGLLVLAIQAGARRFSAPQAATVLTGVLCLLLAARTYARNSDWRDDLSLWSSAVRAVPEAARPHNALGNALEKAGRVPQAITEYRIALRIRPDYAEAHLSLGNAFLSDPAKLSDAIAEFRSALRIEPAYSRAHNGLGIAFLRIPGRNDDAVSEFRAALDTDPEFAEAHANLGSALARIPGEMPAAAAEWQAAERWNPNLAEPHLQLGNYYVRTPARTSDAAAEYQAALAADPDLAEAHFMLGNLLGQSPNGLPRAINEWRAAIRLKPDLAEAHNNLANALAQNRATLPEAIGEWRAALRLNPQLVEAHFNLGSALAQTGAKAEAISEIEAAYRLRPSPQIQAALDQLRK